MKPSFMCIIKDKKIRRSGKLVLLKDYNYLLILMNSAFDYSLSGL